MVKVRVEIEVDEHGNPYKGWVIVEGEIEGITARKEGYVYFTTGDNADKMFSKLAEKVGKISAEFTTMKDRLNALKDMCKREGWEFKIVKY